MSFDTILKSLDKIEPKLAQLPELAASQRELADRVLTLEQKNAGQAPADLRTLPTPDQASSGGVRLRTAAEFKSFYRHETPERVGVAELLRGIAGMKTSTLATKALSVGTDSSGGFAVPRGTFGDILSALVPNSALLQAGASFDPVGDVKSLTTAIVNAIPTAAWRAEGGAIVESDPTFRSVVATPQSLSFRFKVSRELLQDAPNMEAALELVIAQALAKEIDRAGLRGTGVAPQPRGLLNTAGVYKPTPSANGIAGPSYSDIISTFDDILGADAPMPTAAIMSPRSYVRFMLYTDTTGQPQRMPAALDNVRIVTTSQIPNNLVVGTSSDCTEMYVGDFSKMSIMVRETMSLQMLNELYAETGQIGFVGHMRADVCVWYPAAFAVLTDLR